MDRVQTEPNARHAWDQSSKFGDSMRFVTWRATAAELRSTSSGAFSPNPAKRWNPVAVSMGHGQATCSARLRGLRGFLGLRGFRSPGEHGLPPPAFSRARWH